MRAPKVKVGEKVVGCHRYLLIASSAKIQELMENVENDLFDLTKICYGKMEIWEQIMQYVYFQDCDILKEKPFQFTVKNSPEQLNIEKYSNGDLQKSAHVVYQKSKKSGKNQPENANNPYLMMLEVARNLGLYGFCKHLENYTYSSNSNSLKKKKESKNIINKKTWNRVKFEELSDVIITSTDDKEFSAHKSILSARLDYFKSMFSMGWIESQNESKTSVKLPLPSELLKILLEYVYTDFETVPSDDPEFLCNILVMADQLLIPRCDFGPLLCSLFSVKFAC